MRKKILIILIAITALSILFIPLHDEEIKKGVSILGQTTLHLSIKNPISHLDVSGVTDPIQAGQLSDVTVTAIKLGGGVAPDYEGTVTFTSSDTHSSVLLPADYTFTTADAGTHTFSNAVRLITPGEQSVTATDINSINTHGSQNNITVLPGDVVTIVLQADKTTLTANGANQVVITATLEDAFGNKVADGTTVNFSITSGTGSLSASSATTFTGQVQLTYTAGTTAGSVVIQASSGSVTANFTLSLTAGAVTHLEVSGIKSPITAGELSSVRVRALDQYNNVNTQYTGTIVFTSTATQVTLSANYTFALSDQGDHTFTSIVSFHKVGTYSVTATDINDSSITGAQDNIQVIAGAATGSITASGHDVYVNNPVAITSSKVVDAYDNPLAGIKVIFHVVKPDGKIVDLEAETNSEGIASATLVKEQTNIVGTYSVTASATGLISGPASTFKVLAAEEEILIPVPIITYPAYDGQEIDTDMPTIKGTSIANGNITVYIYKPDGTTLTLTTKAAENGLWEVTIPQSQTLANGRYGLQAKVADDLGHESALTKIIYFNIAKKVVPEKPVEPEKPVGPVEPEKPIEPEKPVKPEKPEKPIEPEKPEKPEKPAELPKEKEILDKILEKAEQFKANKEVKKITTGIILPLAGLVAGLILLMIVLVKFDYIYWPAFFIRLWLLLLYFLGIKERTKSWGVVYNAITKEPINSAMIRIFDYKNNKLTEYNVTDSLGRYGFKIKSGGYYLTVKKPGYCFPSGIIQREGDLYFTDIYLGGVIKVEEAKEEITLNVPIDPKKIKIVKGRLYWAKIVYQIRALLAVIYYPVLIIGFLACLFSFMVMPNLFNSLLLGIYLLILVVEHLFRRQHKKMIWHGV